MANVELGWQREEGWMIFRPSSTSLALEMPAPALKDLVDDVEDFRKDFSAQAVNIHFQDNMRRVTYTAIWLPGKLPPSPLVRKPVNETTPAVMPKLGQSQNT